MNSNLAANFAASDRQAFALDIETARALFRRYPELVTAPDFPAEFLDDLKRATGDPQHAPDDTLRDGFMKPERLQEYGKIVAKLRHAA